MFSSTHERTYHQFITNRKECQWITINYSYCQLWLRSNQLKFGERICAVRAVWMCSKKRLWSWEGGRRSRRKSNWVQVQVGVRAASLETQTERERRKNVVYIKNYWVEKMLRKNTYICNWQVNYQDTVENNPIGKLATYTLPLPMLLLLSMKRTHTNENWAANLDRA